MKKILFISYSHDSEEHMKWVKKFAQDLKSIGNFEVLLDQDLPKGYSLTRFMEMGLEQADKVLVIGTPEYKQKSEKGGGTAFEGSIISTRLMQDIDTTKFYPILRSGTYESSFPPALQGRNGDDLSNETNYREMLHIVADSILNETPIPSVLVKRDKLEHLDGQSVAKIDLSSGILFETYFGKPTGRIEGVSIDIQITNKTKEVRYFCQPVFKASIPIVGTNDHFQLLNAISPRDFPTKLEFGQQVSVDYYITQENIELFASLLKKDPNATIQAIVDTTLGERSESNPYRISEIIESSRSVK